MSFINSDALEEETNPGAISDILRLEVVTFNSNYPLMMIKLEKFTKDFVKSDFLKSQNLSFLKSHLRVFGTMIPRKIFFPKIFCVKNIFSKNIFGKNIFLGK